MSDEQQEKVSRRARRREARGEGDEAAAEPTLDAPETPAAEGDADADASVGELVREENRQARRAAAARRRVKRDRERERALDIGLDTTEMVDDAVARGTDTAVKWLKSNFNVLQWIIVVGLGGWIAWEIYSWRQAKDEAKSSDLLMGAVAAERGKIGTPSDEGSTDVRGYTDARKVFSTREAQAKAARERYQAAEAARQGKPIDTLADMGLAGIAYDQGKYGDAKGLYEGVRGSALAKSDPDVRGRAIEGIALSLEGQGKKDDALKVYKELEAEDISGFRELARYSQARLLHDKGDAPGAIALLKKVVEATKKDVKPGEPPGYVAQAARDLLEGLDPKAAAASGDDTKDALQKALEKIQLATPPAPAP